MLLIASTTSEGKSFWQLYSSSLASGSTAKNVTTIFAHASVPVDWAGELGSGDGEGVGAGGDREGGCP